MSGNSSLEKIRKDIDELQKIEKDLLTNLVTNPNLSADEKKAIYGKINGITDMRINLYKTLSDASGLYKDILGGSKEKLELQTEAIGIMEHELDNTKKRIDALNADKNNKMRLVEVNEYYGSQYLEQIEMMKIIIFTLVPIIILSILKKKMLLAFLPDFIYYILLILILIIGGVFFVLKLGNYITRDDMNYQEFEWGFNKNKAPKSTNAIAKDPWAMPSLGACIDDKCCSDDMTYDTTINKCIIGTKESFEPLSYSFL
jgi:hypothetical protein